MKNVHVLPTEKPSRLFLNKVNNKLLLEDVSNTSLKNVLPSGSYQNIYITDDSEIKEGEWVVHNGIAKKATVTILAFGNEFAKKIILTTDTDLIKDGVQAIDDEFLEWFVQNPTCEVVGVIPLKHSSGWYDKKRVWHWDFLEYHIILPQDEAKQENCCTPVGQIKRYVDCKGCDKKPKQETIEEAAEKESEIRYPVLTHKNPENSPYTGTKQTFKHGVRLGAAWQAERMYSEEEVYDLFTQWIVYQEGFPRIDDDGIPNGLMSFNQWFNQNKSQKS